MKFFALVAAAASLSACSAMPVQRAGFSPADPNAPVPYLRYIPVTAGTRHFVPVEPKPWIESNQAVGPQAGAQ
ncbi:hypothetical protein [Devosia sp. LjRoot3]|uniref:hypothetical protein n=1 Tax=Devosia sp. LjRoot3 TaxID=3342319 RepID=UPI003ECC2A79